MNNKKIDITNYSNRELVLLVDNTEYLYKIKHLPRFIDILNNLYIFNDNQLKELKEYLK